MNFMCFIFVVFLFVVLTPSNFVRLPQKGNKWVVSLVHGIIFAVILCFTYHYIMSLGSNIEGFKPIRVVNKTLVPDCNVICDEKLGYTKKDCKVRKVNLLNYNCVRTNFNVK